MTAQQHMIAWIAVWGLVIWAFLIAEEKSGGTTEAGAPDAREEAEAESLQRLPR